MPGCRVTAYKTDKIRCTTLFAIGYVLLLGHCRAATMSLSGEGLVSQRAAVQFDGNTSATASNASGSSSTSSSTSIGSSSAISSSITCRVQLPVKLAAAVEVQLSSECPVHSNGCTGPTDVLPYQAELSPCCHAHDWCYTCGYTQGFWGIQGRRSCDSKFHSNMIAVCKQKFSMNSTDRELCTSTADTMYTAVITYQEGRGKHLDGTAACPGDASKLAGTDFCFTPSYAPASGVVATIQPKNGGKWGAWAGHAKCPQGSWASSLATRIQPYQGLWNDDTGLEAVRMHCTNTKGQHSTLQPLESHPGDAGEWSGFSSCPAGQHIAAFRVRVESDQGLGDDTAASGMRALCSDGVTELYNSNSLDFGAWGEWARCPAGSAVCGFRVRTEQAWAVDNTAVNDIQADCCSMRQA